MQYINNDTRIELSVMTGGTPHHIWGNVHPVAYMLLEQVDERLKKLGHEFAVSKGYKDGKEVAYVELVRKAIKRTRRTKHSLLG